MVLGRRRAAPAAALLVLALGASPGAHAQERSDVLVAQIAQVAQVPDEPPLTGEPPVPLGTSTPAPTASAEPAASAAPVAVPGQSLPETGRDAALVALAGVSLLGMGASLRWAALDGSTD